MTKKGVQILDVISHSKMCEAEGGMLQRGMNFRFNSGVSVILMSKASNAPYNDIVLDNGSTLIYEGHDIPRKGRVNPKSIDQQLNNPSGSLTENGKFYNAAIQYKNEGQEPELVKVYEKIKKGIWVYNGVFALIDAYPERSEDESRIVYKFKLILTDKSINKNRKVKDNEIDLDHNRLIPSEVKREVWNRDKGKCILCGSTTNLHFDHILPFSKGGSSLTAKNIQLLCAKHNLQKSNKIE